MTFTMLNADMSIIQKLADNPTETASELKAKFDEGGEAVKDYLNSVHLPELEGAIEGLESDIAGLETAVGDIPAVVDNLTSTSAADALSANQGRALNTALSGKQKTITAGTGTPSGGSNGDSYIKYI